MFLHLEFHYFLKAGYQKGCQTLSTCCLIQWNVRHFLKEERKKNDVKEELQTLYSSHNIAYLR
jgi:hypothetical protein